MLSAAATAPLFDRRVPAGLMDELRPGGAFDWVVELARRPLSPKAPLDLGLRHSPATGEARATLYVGTTKVLDVHRSAAGRFWVRGPSKSGLFAGIDAPFEAAWSRPQDLQGLRPALEDVRARVERAIVVAPEGRMVEGFLQTAVARHLADGFSPVDREAVLAWPSRRARAEEKAALAAPLEQARRALAAEHEWAQGRRAPGDKIDALALQDGRLLAIEVKPGHEVDTLIWTPLQVGMYVQLMRRWTDSAPTHAAQVLHGMASQRHELGLAAVPPSATTGPLELVPVIAIGSPVPPGRQVRERYDAALAAVRAAGLPLAGLELWQLSADGTVSPTDATTVDERFC